MAKKDNNQEPSDEEIAKANEDARGLGLANLKNDYLTSLAASKFGAPEEYGRLLTGLYENTISQAPDQATYDILFKEALMGETGSLNEGILKSKAAEITQQSLMTITVADALEYAGANTDNLKEDYVNKYIHELSQDEARTLLGSCIATLTDRKVVEMLPQRIQSRAGGLEKIFSNEPEESNEKQP